VADVAAAGRRSDPYANFRFKVQWDGRYVSGVSKVSGLIRTTDVVERREGGEPTTIRKELGVTKYEAITLERGLTNDPAFEAWADEVFKLRTGAGQPNFRKDVIIELLDDAERTIVRYNVLECWPSEYVAIDALDANSDSIIIEKLRLENEGWEREV
jgi:phage tail-like protein